MTQTDVKKEDALAKAMRPHVDALLIRMAAAEIERERCDAIQRRLLATGGYGGDGDPAHVYLLPDADSARYFQDLDREYRLAGYADLEPGHCPALIAESEQLVAENALILAAEEFFPGVTNPRLLCGTKQLGGLEARQKYLDLLIGIVVNHPTYRPITARGRHQ